MAIAHAGLDLYFKPLFFGNQPTKFTSNFAKRKQQNYATQSDRHSLHVWTIITDFSLYHLKATGTHLDGLHLLSAVALAGTGSGLGDRLVAYNLKHQN